MSTSNDIPYFIAPKALIVNDQERVLVLKRRARAKSRPGEWELPGGRPEPGESIDQALIREVREETGLTVRLDGFVGCAEDTVENKKLHHVVYRAKWVDARQTPERSKEHAALRWVARKDLDKLNLIEPLKRVLLGVWADATAADTHSTHHQKTEHVAKAIKQFQSARPQLVELADIVESVLHALADDLSSRPHIAVRVKTPASLGGKCWGKQSKYSEPMKQITDLVGARIITLTENDLRDVCEKIEENADLHIDLRESGDLGARLGPREFGYRGVHYVIRLGTRYLKGVKLKRNRDWMREQRFELQVKTQLQHVWAEIQHDRGYKTVLTIPDEYNRELGRVMALLERADASFQSMVAVLDRYADEALGSEEEARRRIEVMDAVLKSYVGKTKGDERKRRANAQRESVLRLARLRRGINKDKDALKTFRDYPIENNSEVSLERGRIEEARGNYKAAIRHLNAATDVKHRRELVRWLTLARVANAQKNYPEALKQLRAAARAWPTDPEIIVALATTSLLHKRDVDLLDLMRGAIAAALDECDQRLALGIDPTRIRFLQARLELFRDLDSPWEAMNTYLRAICSTTSVRPIIDEKNDIEGIISALKTTPAKLRMHKEWRGLFWAHTLLRVTAVARTRVLKKKENENNKEKHSAANDQVAEDSFAGLTSNARLSFPGNTLIVAGGCEVYSRQAAHDYETLLKRALTGFQGTVVGGGTSAGISGLAARAAKGAAPAATLVGYVPAKRPPADKLEPLYKPNIKVKDDGYTPLGPLQLWADLLSRGVDRSRVRLLGINGGRLSRFEYELALTCGATVVIIAHSLRAADEFLEDPFWRKQPGLVPAPNDPAVVQAALLAETFLQLPDEKSRPWLGKAAEAIHRRYREDELAKGAARKELKPWNELDEKHRYSNYHSAAFFEAALRAIGYRLVRKVDVQDADKVVRKLSANDIETLAKLEHGR
ncbi:MAG: NUDIX domain-containing protein, partial [Phycisphaerae bacterium]